MVMLATWNGAHLSRTATTQTPRRTRQGDIIVKVSLKGAVKDRKEGGQDTGRIDSIFSYLCS